MLCFLVITVLLLAACTPAATAVQVAAAARGTEQVSDNTVFWGPRVVFISKNL